MIRKTRPTSIAIAIVVAYQGAGNGNPPNEEP